MYVEVFIEMGVVWCVCVAQVIFVPDYNVSVAEMLIPASELSQHIRYDQSHMSRMDHKHPKTPSPSQSKLGFEKRISKLPQHIAHYTPSLLSLQIQQKAFNANERRNTQMEIETAYTLHVQSKIRDNDLCVMPQPIF